MNTKSFESKFKNHNKQTNTIQTTWSHVRFRPDLATQEELAIGVFLDIDGIIHSKFIDDFSRIKCAYGDEIATFTESCIELFEDFIHQNYKSSFSSQMVIDHRGFAQGSSVDQILENLMARVVPLSLPHGKFTARKQFHTIKTTTLLSDVRTYVKNKLGDIYKDVFTQEPITLGNQNIGFKKLPIAIQVKNSDKMGDLVSSVYSTPDKLEVNCFRALNNLNIAKKQMDKRDIKLFMLTPDQDNMEFLSDYDRKRRIDILSDFRFSLSSEGIDLIEDDNSQVIAEKIIDWSDADKNYSLN